MKTVAAVYENGVFRPIENVELHTGAEVTVNLPDERDPVEIMKERFPLSFGAISDEDAEIMMRVVEEEFERIDPDDWK